MKRFQQGSLFRTKRKGGADVWVFRWYDYSSGKRAYKKQIIGNVEQMQSKRDAEKSIVALRSSINVGTGTPRTLADLDAHYRKHELTQDKKSFSTIENHRLLYKRYIEELGANELIHGVVATDIFAKRQQITLGVEEPGSMQSTCPIEHSLRCPKSFGKTIEELRIHSEMICSTRRADCAQSEERRFATYAAA